MRADLWTCPHCERQFANRNQQHSCIKTSVKTFLRGKGPRARELFDAFVNAALACGNVSLAPAKTRVGIQARMIFASVNRLSDTHLDAHVVLARRLEHPRFYKVESFSPRNHMHCFRIEQVADIDGEVIAWLREAYAVGEQEHLTRLFDE
ncbi:MAG TPA: DUF5655 domain-containing protein [Longimicrobiales bacterium]